MSRDANGYNKYYRLKVLLNVAAIRATSYSAKTKRVEKGKGLEAFGRPFSLRKVFSCPEFSLRERLNGMQVY